MGKPQQVKDPRSDAAGQISQAFQTALGGGYQPGYLGSVIQDQFQLPAYQGDLGVGVTPDQQFLTNYMQQLFLNSASPFGEAQRSQSLANLQNLVNFGNSTDQQRLSDLLGQTAGTGALSGIAGGSNQTLQQLQNLALTSPNQAAGGQTALAQLLNPSSIPGMSSLQSLLGNQSNPAIAQLLGLTGAGTQQNSQIMQQLLGNANVQTPERSLLQQAAASNPLLGAQAGIGQAQGLLGQLAGNSGIQNLLSGGGVNMDQIVQPLEAARQQMLSKNQQNLAEQFSSAGLRNSTSLADAQSRAATESETNMQAQLAQILPQVLGLQQQGQLGALQGLAGIGGQLGELGTNLGQLGLGRQSNVLQGLGQAGQLGLGAGSLSNQSLLGAGQLGSSNLSTIAQALGQAGQLQLGENQNQAGIAQALASMGLQSIGQGGNLATQLGQLGLQQQGLSADILQNILGQQSGAAQALQQGSLSGANMLSQLMQSGQGNQLQAALALPGAVNASQTLPMQLAQMLGTQFNTNQQNMQQSNLLQYQDFLRQQQLFPQLLSFLGGMSPAQVGPSAFQQFMSGLTSAGALAAGIFAI